MRLDFDEDEDSQAQVILLISTLTEWLSERPEQPEQPEQPPRSGKAQFIYRADGTLDSIHAELDGE